MTKYVKLIAKPDTWFKAGYDNLAILKKGNWNVPDEYNLYLKLKKKYDKN